MSACTCWRSNRRTCTAYSAAGLRVGAGEAERLDADVRLASSRLRGGFSRSRSRPTSLLNSRLCSAASQRHDAKQLSPASPDVNTPYYETRLSDMMCWVTSSCCVTYHRDAHLRNTQTAVLARLELH